jgi:hypothetical protein
MKLSHAESTMLAAIAELNAPIGVGSGGLLGRMIYDARKQKPPARFATSLLIYRDVVNTWVIGHYYRGKYSSVYQNRRALYWYPLPPAEPELLASIISELNSKTVS